MGHFVRGGALALGLVAPGVAWAQADAPDAEPDTVLVTASRTGAASGLVTLDAVQIERRQPASLLEALDDLPGVRAVSLGGPAGPSFLSIRGGEGNFTAVMIDGVRLNDPTNSEGGAFDFSLLDPGAVARVEVARTASSAIHGSDALAGVVQIVTRDPAAAGPEVGASAWLDSRYGGAVSARMSGGWDDGGLLASVGHYDSGDEDPAGTLRRSQGLARARQEFGTYRLNAIGLYAETDAEAFPQDSGGPELAVIRARETRDGDLLLAGASLTRDPEAQVRPSLTIGYSLQHHDSDAPAIAPGALDGVPATLAETRFERLEATGAVTGDLGPLTLSGGASMLREDGRSVGALDFGFPLPVSFERTRVTHSGFAEASLRATDAITISGAARYDDRKDGDSDWTGSGAIDWRLAEDGPRLWTRIASGYKLPSLYALGHPLIGNAALEAETGRSLEAGIDLPLPSGHLAISVFDNRFRNLVDFDPASFLLVNRDRVGATGAELAFVSQIADHWTLGGALTHVSLDSDTLLRHRPDWSGDLRLTWSEGPWEATAALRGNSSFDDSSIPTGPVEIDGHVEADAGVRYALSDRLSVRATLLNIGGDRTWTTVGAPAPGRSVRIALAFSQASLSSR